MWKPYGQQNRTRCHYTTLPGSMTSHGKHTHTPVHSKIMVTALCSWQTKPENGFTKNNWQTGLLPNTCTVDWSTTCVDTLTFHLCSIKSSLRSTSLMGLIIPGPSHFSKLEAVESWAEPGNEATDTKIYCRSGNFHVKFLRFITLRKNNFVFYYFI